jgi:hypothetical protein
MTDDELVEIAPNEYMSKEDWVKVLAQATQIANDKGLIPRDDFIKHISVGTVLSVEQKAEIREQLRHILNQYLEDGACSWEQDAPHLIAIQDSAIDRILALVERKTQ